MRRICRELARAGKTVFINSHILAEIETICDRVALMKEGRIIDEGTVDYFISGDDSYEIAIRDGNEMTAWLDEKSLQYMVDDNIVKVQVPDRSSANSLIDALRSRGVEIESVMPRRKTLESVFLERMT